MLVTYAEAWQISSEIVEMFGTYGMSLPIQDQERMANIILRGNGYFWDDHNQKWQPLSSVKLVKAASEA